MSDAACWRIISWNLTGQGLFSEASKPTEPLMIEAVSAPKKTLEQIGWDANRPILQARSGKQCIPGQFNVRTEDLMQGKDWSRTKANGFGGNAFSVRVLVAGSKVEGITSASHALICAMALYVQWT